MRQIILTNKIRLAVFAACLVITVTINPVSPSSSPSKLSSPPPPPPPPQPNPAPTFYKLAIQWPKAISNASIPNPNRFTIHGLWPQGRNDSVIKGYDPNNNLCVAPDPRVSQRALETKLNNTGTIVTQLDVEWPNLRGSNIGFWFYEWDKHGTCSDFYYDPIKYFETALRLRRGLASADFGLTSGRTYLVSDVFNAVSNFTGKDPQVDCETRTIRGKVFLVLTEIRICYDRPSTLQLGAYKDCPNTFWRACNSKQNRVLLR